MKHLRFCLLLSFFLAVSVLARAQSPPRLQSTTIMFGQSIVPLYGPWKFHIGDNSAWANQNFDDSQWETVDLTPQAGSFDPLGGGAGYVPGWTAKGHPGYWGYAWYRIRVRVATRPGEKLALAGLTDVDDAYQVFVNGELVGGLGKFPGGGHQPVVYETVPEIFLLPQLEAGGANSTGTPTLVLALRVWMDPSTLAFSPNAGGLKRAPLLGEASAVAAQTQLEWLDLVRGYASVPVLGALFFLLAIVAFSLVWFDRSDPVYLWLGWVFLLMALTLAHEAVGVWTQAESQLTSFLAEYVFLVPLILGGWVMVWWVWFRLRRPAWIPRAIAALTLAYAISGALGQGFFIFVSHPVGAAFHFISVVIRLLFLVLLVLIVIWGIRQQGREGWLALPAVALVGIARFQIELALLHLRAAWFPFGIQLTFGYIAEVSLVAVIFALLLRRLLLSVRHQREMALDVQQAAEVQQVLIPHKLPRVSGLTIESEYRPAREVGGDFFQIIPHLTDGSVLIVVGDVTGKGLQAGMLVALIVGVIRTAVETSFDPLEVLQTLNRRLCGRGHAHATCLSLRIAADGAVTLANAGHLPPYLNGNELPMEGALPLGIVPFAEFSVMHFQLASGDWLLLISDGIVEAQDKQGQLFGFERVRAMLQRPITAAKLASAAQDFGQEDDISVLRIVRDDTNAAQSVATPATAIGSEDGWAESPA